MSECPPSNALEAKLATGATIATTTYIDALGRFAKRLEELDRVSVVFADATVLELTKAEYCGLPRATRELLQRQQSSTVPNPTASNA